MHEGVGQRAALGEARLEQRQLGCVRKFPEQQQVGGLLEPEAAIGGEAVDEVLDVDAAVDQLPGTGFRVVTDLAGGHHLADLGQSGQHALAGNVAETPLDIVPGIEFGVHETAGLGALRPAREQVVVAGNGRRRGGGQGAVRHLRVPFGGRNDARIGYARRSPVHGLGPRGDPCGVPARGEGEPGRQAPTPTTVKGTSAPRLLDARQSSRSGHR